ncbi:unnamed protein product [Calypogeia fissa]
MGGESSSSSIDQSMQDMPSGTESELLRIGGAQLYLLDEVESVRMGTGDFALIMMVQANTRLATLVAQVAEFQWPIGKDAPVLQIANLRYTFAMPGLLYGLILPDSTALDLVQRFESYLRHYCTFEIRPEVAEVAGVSDLRLWSSVGRHVEGASEGARYWTAVADDVENYSSKLVKQMQSGSKLAANSILKGGEWATWGIRQGGSYIQNNISGPPSPAAMAAGEEMSPRMKKRVDQARRMSAVAKLLSRTVLKGAISATGHVAIFLGTAIRSAPPFQAFMSSDARREVVIASVDAFAQIVEAVETAGKSLATATSSVGTEIVQNKFGEQASLVAQDGMGAVGNMIDSMWTLNKLGLYMLWRATAASTVLNSRSPSTSRSTSGTSISPGIPSPRQRKSSSPSGISPNALNTAMLQHPSLSIGRTMSVSEPSLSHEDSVPQTAQLFPNSSDQSQPRPFIAPANMYMYPPLTPQALQMAAPPHYAAAAAAYYQAQNATSSPFQQYTRPGVPPQVQPFFPHSAEASKQK